MLSRIWEENRKFLLIAGSGLAVFLILNSYAGSIAGSVHGPKGLYAKATELERDIRRLHKELVRYSELQSSLAAYKAEEEVLLKDLVLPPEPELERFDTAAPLLQFEKAIDSVWGRALDRANRANVVLPEKLSPQDFGVDRRDGKEEYERHYAYLAIVRRALDILLTSGMETIGRPEFVEPDLLPAVSQDGSTFCLFRAIRIRVEGPVASFVKVLEASQSPRDFLQVRIVDLRPRAKNEQDVLRGDLHFVSLRLVDESFLEAEGPGRETGRRGRGGAGRW